MIIKAETINVEMHTYDPLYDEYVIKILPRPVKIITNEIGNYADKHADFNIDD